MKISVIIPVYGVEQFIGRCAETLMRQTLQDVEFIFVDDASPDDSMAILRKIMNDYPERQKNVKIISHQINQGLPAARNSGLSVAKGEYIFHCDSDDFLEYDMLSTLYQEAIRRDADIVWCDWFLTTSQGERYMSQTCYDTPLHALEGMLNGAMKYNVWNKLIRRSLYIDNHIAFPAGYGMGEDMTVLQLFVNATTVAYVPRALYHYCKFNENAFSNTYSDKHIRELEYNTKRTCDYIHEHFGNKMDRNLAFFKLEVKFPFLISDNGDKYAVWKSLYKEANGYAMKNKSISLRRRTLQWMAAKNQWWYVRLYFFIIYKCLFL